MDTRRDSEKNVTGPGYTNSKCQNQNLQAGSDGRAEILSESSWELGIQRKGSLEGISMGIF